MATLRSLAALACVALLVCQGVVTQALASGNAFPALHQDVRCAVVQALDLDDMPTVDEPSAGHRKQTDPETADRYVPIEGSPYAIVRSCSDFVVQPSQGIHTSATYFQRQL